MSVPHMRTAHDQIMCTPCSRLPMKKDTLLKALKIETQREKKVVSDSPGLADFSIGLVIFVLNLPYRQVLCFGEIQITEGL